MLSDWKLEHVVVTPPKSEKVEFFCGQWLGTRAKDGRRERTLKADPDRARDAYPLRVISVR
eukprot:COSAG01_NODE_20901_length_929_cov_0.684337_1_plen_60_part_10